MVCQSVCHLVSPAKKAEAIEMPFALTTGGPRETPVAYGGPLPANTVMCSFNTIQRSLLVLLRELTVLISSLRCRRS